MKKNKKVKTRRFFGMTIGELCAVVTVLGGLFGYLISVFNHIDERFVGIDQKLISMDRKFSLRFDSVEHRLGKVEERLGRIEVDVKETSGLLNNYLTWRFLYQHDPTRKNVEPRYDPNKKTLEFVNRGEKGE